MLHLVNKEEFISAKESLSDATDSDSDLAKSLNVFISNHWMHEWSIPTAYDTREDAHDDEYKRKSKLIMKNIDKFWKAVSPGLTDCHVWLDLSHVFENGDVNNLDKSMNWNDAIISPAVGEDGVVEVPKGGIVLEIYVAKEFSRHPNGYLHRSWCRIETTD
jgi:hypothetical protein